MRHPLDTFVFCPRCGAEGFEINNAKSKRCPSCGFIYYLNPSAACACFITDKMHHVLVAVRKNEPAKGTWDLPGGFIDPYETVEEGVARELLEETGINVDLGEKAGIHGRPKYLFSLPNRYNYSGFEVPTTDLFFHLEVMSVLPYVGKGKDDVSELVEVPFSELDPSAFGLPSIQKAIERVLTNHLL